MRHTEILRFAQDDTRLRQRPGIVILSVAKNLCPRFIGRARLNGTGDAGRWGGLFGRGDFVAVAEDAGGEATSARCFVEEEFLSGGGGEGEEVFA